MKTWGRFGLIAALLIALVAVHQLKTVKAAGGPLQGEGGPYRVLAPIESGNLLLFPVVRAMIAPTRNSRARLRSSLSTKG